jgi:hypothetical protein
MQTDEIKTFTRPIPAKVEGVTLIVSEKDHKQNPDRQDLRSHGEDMKHKPLMDYDLPCRTVRFWDRHYDIVTLPTGEECRVFVLAYGNKQFPPQYGIMHGDGTFHSCQPLKEAHVIFYLKHKRPGLWNIKTGFNTRTG